MTVKHQDGSLISEAKFETLDGALLFVTLDTFPWDMRLDEAAVLVRQLRGGESVVVNRVTISVS